MRTLPYLKAWDKRYRKDGLTIVGVHTPEFPFERDAGNVAEAIERNDIRYPIVQDNDRRPGTPTATSTGRRVLHRCARATSATSTSARANTRRRRW
jgi:hypothetical protein